MARPLKVMPGEALLICASTTDIAECMHLIGCSLNTGMASGWVHPVFKAVVSELYRTKEMCGFVS
jgi:hypothetical protein